MLSRRSLLLAGAAGALGLAGVGLAAEAAEAGSFGITHVATTRPVVALTFDDGPDPAYTPHVLDLLRAAGATATFFVVGKGVHAYPELLRRAVAEGHELANHTATHARLDRLDRAGVRRELEGGRDALEALGLGPSVRPTLVRPPFGFLGDAAREELRAGGWQVALWRGCLERYAGHGDPLGGARRMAAEARRGDVLLAHDGGGPDRAATMAALPELLARLAARGLQGRSLGQLVAG